MMATINDGQMLTPDAVAARLGLHVETVRRMLREGSLPGSKIGPRVWRVNSVKLEQWIAGNQEPSQGGESTQSNST